MWITSWLLSLFFPGGFAFVYEAQDMSSGKDYALKVRHRCTHWGNTTFLCLHAELLLQLYLLKECFSSLCLGMLYKKRLDVTTEQQQTNDVCVCFCFRGCCPMRRRRTRKSYRKSASWYPFIILKPWFKLIKFKIIIEHWCYSTLRWVTKTS